MLEYVDHMPKAPHGLTVPLVALTFVTVACGAKVPPKVSQVPAPSVEVESPTQATAQTPPAPIEQPVVRVDPPAARTAAAAPTQTGPIQEKSEPAPIDQLLEITSEPNPTARPETEKTV